VFTRDGAPSALACLGLPQAGLDRGVLESPSQQGTETYTHQMLLFTSPSKTFAHLRLFLTFTLVGVLGGRLEADNGRLRAALGGGTYVYGKPIDWTLEGPITVYTTNTHPS
jgi:hypothetical protein